MPLREILLGVLVQAPGTLPEVADRAVAGFAADRPLRAYAIRRAVERLEREELAVVDDQGVWRATRAGHRELFAWLRSRGGGEPPLLATEFVDHPLARLRFLDMLERGEQLELLDEMAAAIRQNLAALRALRAADQGAALGPRGSTLLTLAIGERELRLRHLRRVREAVASGRPAPASSAV